MPLIKKPGRKAFGNGILISYGDILPGQKIMVVANPVNVEYFRNMFLENDDVTVIADRYAPPMSIVPWWRRLFLREEPEPIAHVFPEIKIGGLRDWIPEAARRSAPCP